MRLRLPERLLACLFRHLVAALAVLLLFKLALVLTMAAVKTTRSFPFCPLPSMHL